MTALTVPARPEQDASLRPVPWRRMAWVTWRQHRFALAGVAALLAALAVWLWLEGLHAHHAYTAAADCRPASSGACGNLVGYFLTYVSTAQTIAIVLQAVPALIGAFVGAPVLAREMETGTFRYAWTQGFGRWRWTLAKLVPFGIAVAVAAGAFSLLFSWYYQPFFTQTLSFNAQVPLDAGRLRDRRPGRHAHPPGRHRDRRHPGRLHRARRRSRPVPARALHGAAAGQERERSPLRMGHQPAVVRQGRPAGQPERAQPGPPAGGTAAGRREGRDPAGRPHGEPVPRPARVHAVDHLPAGQPVLAVPVDRGRLAARAVGAAYRRHRLAGAPPRRLT